MSYSAEASERRFQRTTSDACSLNENRCSRSESIWVEKPFNWRSVSTNTNESLKSWRFHSSIVCYFFVALFVIFITYCVKLLVFTKLYTKLIVSILFNGRHWLVRFSLDFYVLIYLPYHISLFIFDALYNVPPTLLYHALWILFTFPSSNIVCIHPSSSW